MAGREIEGLIRALARLPGLGPRSARRAALTLIKRRDTLLLPLRDALDAVAATVCTCSHCGNIDTVTPCSLCTDPERDSSVICVVEEVGDLWAIERTRAFHGHYHVLGGVLSALDGVGPQDLTLDALFRRATPPAVREVILALNATVDGQTTAHVISEKLATTGLIITRLAQGVPLGGELGTLDDGTLTTALRARRQA